MNNILLRRMKNRSSRSSLLSIIFSLFVALHRWKGKFTMARTDPMICNRDLKFICQ